MGPCGTWARSRGGCHTQQGVLGQRLDVLGDAVASGEHRRAARRPSGARSCPTCTSGWDGAGGRRAARPLDAASHWSQGVRPGSSGQRHPMTTGTPACSAAARPVATVSGPTNSAAYARVREDVGQLLGVEVEVPRHRRDAGQQSPQVGEHGLGAVVGEHGVAALRAEVHGVRPVGHPVQRLVDLGPARATRSSRSASSGRSTASRDAVSHQLRAQAGGPRSSGRSSLEARLESRLDLTDRVADIVGLALLAGDADDPVAGDSTSFSTLSVSMRYSSWPRSPARRPGRATRQVSLRTSRPRASGC